MKLLHIFQYWTQPNLWTKPNFWYYNEVTPAGFRLLTLFGFAMVFDRPERTI
jgi:hypothetical protein